MIRGLEVVFVFLLVTGFFMLIGPPLIKLYTKYMDKYINS